LVSLKLKMVNGISKLLLLGLLLNLPNQTIAQTPTQTIRGTVTDKVSQTPIIGAIVVLLNSDPVKSAVTDADGNFKMLLVPVGEQTLKISYLGYKELLLPNIDVSSGKEVVLNIALEENIAQLDQVVVTNKVEKNKALNQSAIVSARTFSVEETQKYAAAINDPMRMVTSFPGVNATGGNGNNNISIRGNAPNGLLWRMEGVEIPNPNHFSSVGTSGGGISILSSQLLTNSDFLTGAFPAEYGNALSGVFDLKLRKGNDEKREFTVKASFIGIDLAAEGPFKKGYGGSYLINYRYSTPTLIEKLGVDIGTGAIAFQDLSYNFYFPAGKAGVFTLFGFGGLSSQKDDAVKDSSQWANVSKRISSSFYSNTGATGITHFVLLNNTTWLKSALIFSGTNNGNLEDKLIKDYNQQRENDEAYIQNKITLSATLNKKLNTRHSFKAGVILNKLYYSFVQHYRNDTANVFLTPINEKGSDYTFQSFAEWSYKASEKLTLNAGMHYLMLLGNHTWSIEPRASVKYDISSYASVAFGYGLHSQVQPLGVYFVKVKNPLGNESDPNKNLALTKSEHFVLSYDQSLTEFIHLKAEVYYQYLFNVPVSIDRLNTYSILNLEGGYPSLALVNNGKGRNYGLEISFEQFLHKGMYYILSTSLYDSKYQASNGIWYNTRFNSNYSFTATGGKEFKTGDKFQNRVIGVNLKGTYAGGLRETPVDLPASVGNGYVIYKDDMAYANKMPDYFRADVGFSLKRNRKKSTVTWSIDIQNVTNTKNIFSRYFDPETKAIKTIYQAGILPILSYRLDF
jgi:carbon monoxide dehydrogenase subunit G